MYLYYITPSELSSVNTMIESLTGSPAINYPEDYIKAFDDIKDNTISKIFAYTSTTGTLSESEYENITYIRPYMFTAAYGHITANASFPYCLRIGPYGFN